MPTTFKAHFDGTHIVLDEPADLTVGARLSVTVLDAIEDDDWRQKWQSALAKSADDEPEYLPHDAKVGPDAVRVWRLITHHQDRDRALRWSLNNGRMALGWGIIGELEQFRSEAEIAEAIVHQSEMGNHPLNNSKAGGFSLWNFAHTMQIGDLVILRGEKLSRVVEVIGEPFFESEKVPTPGDFYNYQRRVRATTINAQMLWQHAGKMARDGGSIYRTLIRCERRVAPAGL